MHKCHTGTGKSSQTDDIVLKRDLFGTIRHNPALTSVTRETATAPVWVRRLARSLCRREARILQILDGRLSCPQLLTASKDQIVRSHLPGTPMYAAPFDPRTFFSDALRQLRRMHAAGVAHNDLAKEANWICMPGDRAGIVDFQIAAHFPRRGQTFRILAREDLRHLLKHKRYYAADSLTARQRAILAQPLWPARFWRTCVKPVYLFVTRRILGWAERSSAVERSI